MLKKIKKILEKHVGKENAISAAKIAKLIGKQEDDTHARTRDILFKTAKKYKLPLAATSKGYYLIETEDEYNEYIDNLNKRIKGIKKRKKIITENYKGHRNED